MTKETAMKILKELHDNSLFSNRIALETLIPELADSNDERIRKCLIDFFEDWHEYRSHCWGIAVTDILAWLEKQGSSSVKWQKNTPHNKPAINHSVLMKTTQGIAEGEWQGEDWFQYRWSWTLKESNVLAWMELSDLNEQAEQKPAWSEEDEKMCKIALSCIETLEDISNGKNMHADVKDWLKSLKERISWKPSEKQMEALHNLNLIGKIDYAGQAQALIELYNDLKKL